MAWRAADDRGERVAVVIEWSGPTKHRGRQRSDGVVVFDRKDVA
ncbi:MAG: hypothetical protein ACYC77_03575 [Coriobacteriia bacterium]